MNLFYFHDRINPNFGDELNAFLWPRLFGDIFDGRGDCLFLGIGTILDRRVPVSPRTIVFGTGVRNPADLPVIDESWDIRFVRGPKSSSALGGCRAISDSAYCLRLLEWKKCPKVHRVSFVPWYLNRGLEWAIACRQAGVKYIDPCRSVGEVIEDIRSSELVITEAMHGAIVADAFGVPWIRVKSRQHRWEKEGATEWKWADWAESVGVSASGVASALPERCGTRQWLLPWGIYRAVVRKASALKAAAKEQPRLSSDVRLCETISQLNDEVQRLSGDLSRMG